MFSATTFVTYVALGLTALSSLVSANPTTPSLTTRDVDLTNPQGINLRPVDTIYSRGAFLRTNGERMKRGLAPLPPKRRNTRSRLEARQSPTLYNVLTGTVSASYVDNSGTVTNGWVSATPNGFGEYGFATNLDLALHISICNEGSDGPFEISTTNGISTYPFWGLFKGSASTNGVIGTTSSNYAYLGGTSHTPAGSPPTNAPNSFTAATGTPESVESTVWYFGTGSSLTPTWVNPDGTNAVAQLFYSPASHAFGITGNIAQFRGPFGAAYTASFSFFPDP